MQHRARRGAWVGPQHREEVRVCVPLVQEERLVQPCGEAELQLERPALLGGRREIPEVVEPAFTRGDDHRIRDKRGEPRRIGVAERRRVVRMHAGSRAQEVRVWPAERDGLLRVVERASPSRPSPRRQRRAPARARPRGPRRSCRARGSRRCRRARERSPSGVPPQAARSAVVTGWRAARNAGRNPPTMPIDDGDDQAIDDERGRDCEAETRPA